MEGGFFAAAGLFNEQTDQQERSDAADELPLQNIASLHFFPFYLVLFCIYTVVV